MTRKFFALLAFGTPVLVFLTTWLQLPILPVALLGFLYTQSKAWVPGAEAPVENTAPRLGTADSAAL